MQRTLLLTLIVSSLLLQPSYSVTDGPTEYKSKDGHRVAVIPVRKWTRSADYISYESKVEFYSPQREMLCAIDYSSEDAEHGFEVVKAAWTPDSKYFVFSLTSSGGHQPWHAPTFFYSIRDNEIRSLDSYVQAAGISNGDFTLESPNVVHTEVWRGQSVPANFPLDSLMAGKHKSPRPIPCTGGKAFQPER